MRALRFALPLLMISGGALAEDCMLPMSPRVPDGRFASEDDMRRARQEMQSFVGRADDFLKCIDEAQKEDQKSFEAAGGNDPGRKADFKVRQTEYQQRYNAGVDAQKAAADKFNEQLHIWRSKAGQANSKQG